jgi:catalase
MSSYCDQHDADTHRYRLGVNHTHLPVNRPHAAEIHNYGRDGAMRSDGNAGRAKNYEPNSYGGPGQTNQPLSAPLAIQGMTGAFAWVRHAQDNDFGQAGALYRLMPEPEKERLVANIAASLSRVSRDDIITRSIAHLRNADADFGARIEKGIRARRAAP